MTLDEQTQREFARICPSWAELFQTYKFNVMMENHFCRENLCKTGNERVGEILNIQQSV